MDEEDYQGFRNLVGGVQVDATVPNIALEPENLSVPLTSVSPVSTNYLISDHLSTLSSITASSSTPSYIIHLEGHVSQNINKS